MNVGCEVNGVCKDEKSVWTDQAKCIDYQCVREMRYSQIYMVTKPVSVGMLEAIMNLDDISGTIAVNKHNLFYMLVFLIKKTIHRKLCIYIKPFY